MTAAMVSRPATAQDMAVLTALPLFARLEAADLDRLLGRTPVRAFAAPAPLFTQGEPADAFFAVLSGRVDLFTLTAEGHQGMLTAVLPGESFAEAAMFGSGRFPVNAEAQAGTAVARIERRAVERVLAETPAVGLRMLDALLARQGFLIAEVRWLREQSPARRLASTLLALAEGGGWQGSGRLPLRKQWIASRIGIEPETLSRVLRRLTVAGVSCPGDAVEIVDLDRLRAYCAGDDA